MRQLQAELERRSRDCREEVERRLEERRRLTDEYEALSQRDADKVKTLGEKLEKTQQLLYMSVEDVLSMTCDCKTGQRHCMIEKDKLLRELDYLREELQFGGGESATGDITVARSRSTHALHDCLTDQSGRQHAELQVRARALTLCLSAYYLLVSSSMRMYI